MYTLAYRHSCSAYAMLLHLEPETFHAHLVLLYRGLAVFLGVRGPGHEHALVPLRLLVLAHAAGLWFSVSRVARIRDVGDRTLGLDVSEVEA